MSVWMDRWMNETCTTDDFIPEFSKYFLLIFWVFIVIILKCTLIRKANGNEAKQEINSHFLNSPDYFLLSLRPKTNTKAGNHNCFRTPFYSDFGLVWLTHPIGAQIPNWTKSSPAVTLLLPSHHHQIQSGQLAGVLGWEGKGRRIGLLFKATEGAACPEFRWKPTLYPPVFTAPQPQASFRAMWPVDSSSFSLLEPRAILVPWCLALKVPISMHSKIQPIHDLDL